MGLDVYFIKGKKLITEKDVEVSIDNDEFRINWNRIAELDEYGEPKEVGYGRKIWDILPEYCDLQGGWDVLDKYNIGDFRDSCDNVLAHKDNLDEYQYDYYKQMRKMFTKIMCGMDNDDRVIVRYSY